VKELLMVLILGRRKKLGCGDEEGERRGDKAERVALTKPS
jgi:hypothetical protein